MEQSPRVLWVGDAGTISGYSKVTENVCNRLVGLGWDVRVLGIGYNGDPHNQPYRIYPGVDANTGGPRNGAARLKEIIDRLKPDVVLILDDHWNVSILVDNLAAQNLYPPIVGYIAVDSENVRYDVAIKLRLLKHAICHTQFGVEQLVKGGFTGQTSVAGHGVDCSIYDAYNKKEARDSTQIRIKNGDFKDAFVWGCVGMNQPRKRLDLTVAYFAAWWKRAGRPDNAYLYLHTPFSGVWDITQLSKFLGIEGRILTTAAIALQESHLPTMYSIFDAMISTSEGESWGLTSQEGAACAVPQIAVRCGGMPSWAGDAFLWVEPSSYSFTANRTNTKRYQASEIDFIDAMDVLYKNPDKLKEYSVRAYDLAHNLPTWDNISEHISGVLTEAVQRSRWASNSSGMADFE